jgi:hypothetical protein
VKETSLAADITPPIVADLGTARRKHIEDLRTGTGPLVDDIQAAMACVHANAELAGTDRVFVPVVVICTQGERDDEDEDDLDVENDT